MRMPQLRVKTLMIGVLFPAVVVNLDVQLGLLYDEPLSSRRVLLTAGIIVEVILFLGLLEVIATLAKAARRAIAARPRKDRR